MTALANVKVQRDPVVTQLDGGKRALQLWPLPLDEAFLEEFLTYIFRNYWDQIVFGPVIEGAAYELTCPREPSKISLFDGFSPSISTVRISIFASAKPRGRQGPHFGRSHIRARRKPSVAQIFRRLDIEGAPILWGFEMKNGAGEPMISIIFANPFFLAGDKLTETPQWERLAMWRDIAQRYLGREPEEFDASSQGFRGGHG